MTSVRDRAQTTFSGPSLMKIGAPSPFGYFSFLTTQNCRDFHICAGVSEKVGRFARRAGLVVQAVG